MGVYCFRLNAAGLRAYERRGFMMRSEVLEPQVKEMAAWMEWDAAPI
jgi:hypothetical protein